MLNELERTYYTTQDRIAKKHIRDYDNAHHFHLWDCYENYSKAKEKAFEYCENLCNHLHGWGLRILSHNSQMFTVGFLFMDNQTGVIRFAYITKDYDRYCDYVN